MKNDLLDRTQNFALNIIKFVQSLPNDLVNKVLGNQLLRGGTSIGANYRAAQRAKSKADFIYKIKVVEEEADESIYWLELISKSKIVKEESKILELLKEANELTAIFSSISTKLKRAKS